MTTKSCLQCSKEFKAYPARQKYCGRLCAQEKQRQDAIVRDAKHSYARRHATAKVTEAVFRGRLIPQPCELCGKPKAMAHHDDYAAPLDVRWLCHSHHQLHHLQHGPGKNA